MIRRPRRCAFPCPLAVARQFGTDSRIFSAAAGSEAEGNVLLAMISFDRTADEMRGLVAQGAAGCFTLAFYPLDPGP